MSDHRAGRLLRIAVARVVLRGGVGESTELPVSAAGVAERVGWAADLVSGMASAVPTGRWSAAAVAALASGLDGEGRGLPTKAWVALRRPGWAVAPPTGVRVDDRTRRMAQEQAGRALRSAAWPVDPRKRSTEEWAAVRSAVPRGLSRQVRGSIVDRLRHAAAEHGTALVAVPSRDTSRRCPRCLTTLRHRKAPDRPATPGWKWASCPARGCGYQGDRDQGAWHRIAARGLSHRHRTTIDRSSGTLAVRAVVDRLEAREPRVPRPGDAGHPPLGAAEWDSVRGDTPTPPRRSGRTTLG